MNGEVVLTDDVPATFTRAFTAAFAVRPRPIFSVALSGGSTARRCYERLAEVDDETFWPHLELFWGDERCVPLDDEDSNFRLARVALGDHFDRVHAVHPMTCTEGAATAYDERVRSVPRLDLVHLGLGPDGHTASLFPGSAALETGPGHLVTPNEDPLGVNPHPRLTFTFEGIARAALVIVTVEGNAKHDALDRVLTGDTSAPAARIEAESLLWIVDADALGSSQPR